jgi:uncharacterized protein YeeX (DUF496 family)
MRTTRIIRLSEPAEGKRVHFLSDVLLDATSGETVMTVARVGKFWDPRYGEFEITLDMLKSMVRNFDSRVVGTDIALDVSHKPQDGAAGWIRRLFLDGNKLRAAVEFTPFGVDARRNRGMKYVSAEYSENYVTNEVPRTAHGPTLLGAALTPRPVIKHMDPVDAGSLRLADESLSAGVPTLVSHRIVKHLAEETAAMNELLKKLRKRLADEKKLAEPLVNSLCTTFEKLAAQLAEDKREALIDVFLAQADDINKQLAEAGKSGEVTIKLDATGLEEVLKGTKKTPASGTEAKTLSEEQVRQLFAEMQADANKKLADEKKKIDDLRGTFDRLLTETENLDQDLAKELGEGVRDTITANMTEDQVKRLADTIVKSVEKVSAQKKLAARGFAPQGAVHITIDESGNGPAVQGLIDKQLSAAGVRIHEKPAAAVNKVLAVFDMMMAPRLDQERKFLADGATNISDSVLPAGFQRTVIREALSDLNILMLVNTITNAAATATMNIPYETRDISAIQNDGVVYERQGIKGASVRQAVDLAYIVPTKLAMEITEEVMFFSRNNPSIDWDAFSRNVQSNARVVRELLARRIANEMQRSADAYGAVAVVNENVDALLNAARDTIALANFPLVRPKKVFDLQGNQIGATEHPISVTVNGAALNEWDGTGSQAAGTYWRVVSYNLGTIQFVDKDGNPVTPDGAQAGASTVSYSYATNVSKFDIDLPANTTKGVHYNGLLSKIGARKAILSGERFVQPDFQLMSPTLNNEVTDADNFKAAESKNGTGLNNDGDLEMVKGVPAFGTNAPNLDLGDERILLGQRGVCTYGVAKPYEMGQPFEAVNGSGEPIGVKRAYGTEFSTVHIPAPLRGRMTSVIVYSASDRAAINA